MTLDANLTLAAACLALLLGTLMVRKIKFLQRNHIPEAVAGGFVVALGFLVVYQLWGISVNFNKPLQDMLLLTFFTSIGLSSDFSRLLKGGKPLVIFILAVATLIFVQNVVGMGMALALGQNPFIGLIAGSITLSGGHGNGAAWAPVLSEQYGVTGALELAMACATLGLVLGGLVGGPVARHLLKKVKTPSVDAAAEPVQEQFEQPQIKRSINAANIVETVGMLAVSMALGSYIDGLFKDTVMQMPTFVWCLFVGVILRNLLTHGLRHEVFEPTIDVLGNVCLSFFLAIALMSLKLGQLTDLALPVLLILAVQTVVMVLFACFVTFRVMGKDYDAVVMSAGHCGFGLGATPTAIANMQVITKAYGPSHKAFLVVPMVGAFFVDLANSTLIKVFMVIGSYFA
ncbi:MAG: sodium/glutamate symporter [Neisseriaceae bacterium]|nr:sodium/glutamate symporter [Neisseriaceae bacterium]